MTVAATFDFARFKRAFAAKDVPAWIEFYADDAEWLEYKPSAPPRAPVRMRGREEIAAFLGRVAAAPIEIEVFDEVVGPERAAFCVNCTMPDGRRIIENVIVHIAGGRIARQVDVEAWDP
jgi:ketosteroid isomerase-like protein